jgi:hypothetical protein
VLVKLEPGVLVKLEPGVLVELEPGVLGSAGTDSDIRAGYLTGTALGLALPFVVMHPPFMVR